ncbi:MAG TPA: threonine--tRNA ligase [Candidatus Acidoferrales bacterium]|nr:threonine--tRNA ligase [Candidatus Acidoferrales bacterium]
MENIQITLPDGSTREVPSGTSSAQVAAQIGPRLAKDALVARVDGELTDLSKPLDHNVKLSILTAKDPDAVQVFRHSAAHLLAAAVLELYPDVKLGVGPPIDTGFFYEFVREQPFTPDDLEKIEAKMREIAARDVPNERKLIPKSEALELYRKSNQQFKCELVEEKAVEPLVSFYTTGKFIDFCRGPHIPSTGRIKAFKLMNVAGAYWKGDEKNPQMQRIYGACFVEQKELDEYLHKLEEAKRRDHRRLGTELDLFSIQDEAGPGLIFWHPKGAAIRRVMEDWLKNELVRHGYEMVYTPHIMRLDLWKTSGHAIFYRENMFGPVEVEKAEYQLKPMNCPGHVLIFKSHLRSYRELPVRLAELGTVYRYERSGVLHGLMRVRGFTQDDAHIFCTPEQIEKEIQDCVEFAWEVLRVFGFNEYVVELSGGDSAHPEIYAGTPADWKRAEDTLTRALENLNVPYKYIPGEAAFYGPKIDVKLVDAIGRPWQLTTVQFDFNLPSRFELAYVGEDGARHRPLMVHRALWGSVERFFGVLIEHYAGAFPAWLAPVQVSVLPLSEKTIDYARKITQQMKDAGFRVHLDDRNEKLQGKIRDAQLQKIPYMLVLGGREAEAGTVGVRHRAKGDLGPRPVDQFIADLRAEVDTHAIQ